MENHLTQEHARMLLEAVRGDRLEAIITLALMTGLRRDELLGLQWQAVDLEKRELLVLNTKTQSGSRKIRVPEEVTEVLRQHHLRQAEDRLEAGVAWQNLDLVFADRAGGPLRPEHLVQRFHALLSRAELPPLRFHELRMARYRALHQRVRTAQKRSNSAQAGYLDLDKDPYPF
jgi:integrase